MEVLRTPEERFSHLPDYPFKPHYHELPGEYEGLRFHCIDEGPHEAEHIFLCLHGEPTWGYLYRKMIPVFIQAGHRVVAPDFFGFGRSDKPVDEAVYTFDFHRMSIAAFIERLDLRNITLVCQDWGGLIGLTLPMDMPDRFSRFLIMNTMLGTGDEPLSKGFLAWRTWNNKHPDMAVGKLIGRACPHLSEAECAAHDAPFPDATYKAGVRRFPNIVPDRVDAPGAPISRRARIWLRAIWAGQTFMAVGIRDPVLGPPVMDRLKEIIRGCPEPYEMHEAGHFVQEWGREVAERALESFEG
ncbi:MAG: alpha/beta fold hydrolase [Deltaproteobacteria bacterium]|nr:alpha/beta fold hydrolase [Deltaproteobacteria bacterium]